MREKKECPSFELFLFVWVQKHGVLVLYNFLIVILRNFVDSL